MDKNRRKTLVVAGMLAGACLLALGGVVASTDGFNLGWHLIAGGGGRSSSAGYAVHGSIGQHASGGLSSADYRLGAGFWYAEGSVPPVQSPTATATPTRTPGAGDCDPPLLEHPQNATTWPASTSVQLQISGGCSEFYIEIWSVTPGVNYQQNSGWMTGLTWSLGQLQPARYEWHAKGRNAPGGETDWSGRWHFYISEEGTPTPTGAPPLEIYLPMVVKNYRPFCDDEFDGAALAPCWSWVNEDPAQWSLTARPGFLRITTHPGKVYEKNLLLQTAPTGDFDVRTRLLFQPTSNYQIAGIVLYQNAQNFLVLGRAFCDAGFCVGNGIYFDWVEGGTPGGQAAVLSVANPNEAYLRVVRQGNSYSGYYSADGSAWTLVGSYAPGAGIDLSRVGVAAAQDQAGIGILADFDWFRFE